jgi:DNA-binding transcriptional LysR family regulator
MDGAQMDEINAFLAVVETQNFTAAGRLIERDASVVSRRVSALEARLGIRLVERSTRRVSPTEAGSRFAERTRAALVTMQEAEAEATQASHAATGTLKIAVPGAFGRLWVAPLLPMFLAKYPGVSVTLEHADRYVDLLAEGFDLAIRLGALEDSRLIAKKLTAHRRLICASPGYLQRKGIPQVPGDLADHACLRFSRLATHPEWRFKRDGEIASVEVTGPLTADDAQTLVTAALSDAGIVMCSDWLSWRERADGRLKAVLQDWTVDGEGAIYVVRPPGRFTPSKTRAFVDWISEQLSAPPWMEGGDSLPRATI